MVDGKEIKARVIIEVVGTPKNHVEETLSKMLDGMRQEEGIEVVKKELFEAIESGDIGKMEDELGDVFFSLVNFARFLQVDAENALERTNKKFISRFTQMEAEIFFNHEFWCEADS